MKKIMIFGAGQAGNMMSNWINGEYEVLGFIDNNPNLWGECKYDKKIYSPKESIRLIASEIREQNLEGEGAELGVYKGKFAAEINRLFPNKRLYLFDTFEGFRYEDVQIEAQNGYSKAKEGDFSDTNIELVKNRLPYEERAVFIKGYFPESVREDLPSFCFVSLDTDLYKPTYEGLRVFYPKLVKGGAIIIHDYNSSQFPGVKKAVKEFCKENEVSLVPLCDMHGSAILIKN